MLFAVAAKIILFFFAYKGKKGMLKQQRLAPKQKELEKKYKNDKAKYQEALAKMYQDEGVSPMGGCLWMLIPFPIMIALYTVVRQPLQNIMQLSVDTVNKITEVLGLSGEGYYNELIAAQAWYDNAALVAQKVPEVADKVPMDFTFLGIFNLAEIPHLPWNGGWSWLILIPILSAASSLLSTIFNQKVAGTQPQPGNGKLMMYVMGPGMSLWFGFIMPGAMGVYWIAQNLINMVQEYFLTRHFNKVLDAEDAQKKVLEERRKEAELRQREEDRQRRVERIAEQNKKHKPKKYKLQAPIKTEPEQTETDDSGS